MEEDIIKVVKEFQEEGFIDWRLNNTYITLTPKVEAPKDIGDFSKGYRGL